MKRREREKILGQNKEQVAHLEKMIDLHKPDFPRLRNARLPREGSGLKPYEAERHLIHRHTLLHLLREENQSTEFRYLPPWATGSLRNTYGHTPEGYDEAQRAYDKLFPKKTKVDDAKPRCIDEKAFL